MEEREQIPTAGAVRNIMPLLSLCLLYCFTVIYWISLVYYFRLKAAEETFKQAREKANYNVKPKHASGIVSLSKSLDSHYKQWITHTNSVRFYCNQDLTLFLLSLRKPSWDRRCEFLLCRIQQNSLFPLLFNSSSSFFFFFYLQLLQHKRNSHETI